MLKFTLSLLLSTVCYINSYASVSLNTAQDILNKMTSANGMRPIKIKVIRDSDINAFGSPGYVGVTTGMLQFGNASVLTAVLAHELGHAKGISSEIGADKASVGIGRKAGLDVCPGARQFLSTIGKKGGGVHPPGMTRLERMGCK